MRRMRSHDVEHTIHKIVPGSPARSRAAVSNSLRESRSRKSSNILIRQNSSITHSRLYESKAASEHRLLREYVREVLNEPPLNEAAFNVVMDVVGLIPGLGEFADAANAVSYAKQGEYLFAGLSIISMVPEIGDAIGKGGKLAVWLTKSFPKGMAQVAKHGPDVVKGIKSAQSLIKKHKGIIKKLITKLEESDQFEAIKEYLPKIKGAIDAFINLKPEQSEEQGSKEGSEESSESGAKSSSQAGSE